MKRVIIPGLIAAILLQIGVLAAEYIGAIYPLWTGQEVRLKTVPVDPRSLFRGNYARLRYEISRIDLDLATPEAALRNGEVIYVSLEPTAEGVHGYAGASLEKPGKGLFIRGRIQTLGRGGGSSFPVDYGIEAFFAPKEKALDLERRLRDGGIALVMVSKTGRATLKDVIPN